MSWGTCYGASNNIHFDYPPIMDDGRNYSDWQPGAAMNEKMKEDAGIKTNWQYRRYLTQNADEIIKYNQILACNQCGSCPVRYENQETSNSPFLYKSSEEKTMPYGYVNSDLKNLYLSKQDLEQRLNSPQINQEDYLKKGIQNYN